MREIREVLPNLYISNTRCSRDASVVSVWMYRIINRGKIDEALEK